MGVTGLWRLIEPAGKPVPVETLENKVLAVDISIWLHQMVKGYQDSKGAPLPNAHLMGLFQRLCKLLYFRIKPVFVFDGGFPELKKETIGKRQDSKAKYNSESERLKREIALLLGKKTAIGALLGKQIPQKKNEVENDDMFKLPALPEREQEPESESEDESSSSTSSIDLHSVDLDSDKFKNLPAKDKYDLLVELKETRKMNSWGKLHTLPKKSDNFSDFQMQRLLKRRKVQECLEETEKEIGEGSMSLNELESLLNEEGIDTKIDNLPSRRIASNESTRYVLISSVKQALAEAKKKQDREALKQENNELTSNSNINFEEKSSNDNELEDDLQKAIKMSLECMEDQDMSANTSKADSSWTSNFSDYSDSEDDDGFAETDISSAKAYIKQYSDFTHKAIDDIVESKFKEKKKVQRNKVEKIIEDLNKEKSIIEEKVELSSSEDDNTKDYNINVLPVSLSHSSVTVTCERKNIEKRVGTQREECEPDLEPSKPINVSPTSLEMNMTKEDKCSDAESLKIGVIVPNINDASVIIVEKKDEIISLDESCENQKSIDNKQSDSSDDDFEEVPETENKTKTGVVQLTLNINGKFDDDIFADVFEQNAESNMKESEKKENVIKVNINEKECPIKTTRESLKHDSPVGTTDLNNTTIVNDVTNTIENKKKFETTISSAGLSNESNTIVMKEKLNSIVSEIENKEENLIQEKGRLDRIGRNITEEMTKEAQELLQIFGIPYIIAPMEAEAQCAFLESVNLTDGTITDDSDIWLFGGQTVYKNFFNQKKLVLQYISERIEKSFNLNREQLVLLALLVGSDYTTGVSGVGPVTALEILASFPYNKKKLLCENSKQARYQEIVKGLMDFKKWVRAGKRTDNISLKKKLKNVNLNDDFPSIRVIQAYLEPNVERSEEKFTWGDLDITILRDYARAKFGWSQNKLDEIIKPVLKRMQERKNQKTVHDYFKRKTEFQSLEDQMSKRVKAAVQKMCPQIAPIDLEEKEDAGLVKKKTTRKRKITKSKTTAIRDDIEASTSSGLKRSKGSDDISSIHGVVNTIELVDKEQKMNIDVIKTQKLQELIPQREKDKRNMLENKLKAIETFRKTKIDRKTKTSKRRLPRPKENAELSENSESN